MSVALVLGGGKTIWSDVSAALDLGVYDAVVACNDAASVWPGRLDAAVSLHAEKLGFWMERREVAGHPMPDHVVGHSEAGRSVLRISERVTEFVEYRFDGQRDSGSSGLFALKYALENMGCDRAVLCGVPMQDSGAHFFDLAPWGAAAAHKRGWVQALPLLRDRARSMSGWTAETLGRPTKEWLTG